jgi:hypothetical protein
VSARPSQYPWTRAEIDELPDLLDIPTAASVLHTGVKTLRAKFNGSHTAIVHVGDREVRVESLKLGRQRWVTKESLRPVFDARGP